MGFWGALVWVLFYFNIIEYPGALHPEIMMGGFLLSFVLGFLGTAAPKFTNSFPATSTEIKISLLLVFFLFVSQFFPGELYFRFSCLSVFIFLIYFLQIRFRKRTANPPTPFILVGVGVIIGTLGSALLILSKLNLVSDGFYMLGRLFFFQGYILSFVLGIGSRLIPSLLGHAPPPNMAQKGMSVTTYLFLGLCFLFTYFAQIFINENLGLYLRVAIVIFIALASWKIYLLPKRKAIHAYGLWLSCVFMVIGYVSAAFFETYAIHFMHLFYISGLSLMTIMVASRVTLSHGSHDMMIEVSSKPLLIIISLFILAALTRLSAGFLPNIYFNHLFYAASVWLVGLVGWGYLFLPKMIKVKN